MIVIGLGLSLLALLFVRASDPFAQPGETWRLYGMLRGSDVRLYPDGRYAGRDWCDVCPAENYTGRWTERDGLVELRPDTDAGRAIKLRRMQAGSCEALVPVRGEALPPLRTGFVFYREPGWCPADEGG